MRTEAARDDDLQLSTVRSLKVAAACQGPAIGSVPGHPSGSGWRPPAPLPDTSSRARRRQGFAGRNLYEVKPLTPPARGHARAVTGSGGDWRTRQVGIRLADPSAIRLPGL